MHLQAKTGLTAWVNGSEDLVWSVDLEFRVTSANEACREYVQSTFGVAAEVGQNIKDILPPERADILLQAYRRALAEGPFTSAYDLTNGWTLEVRLSPIVVDGKPVGISAIGKNVTRLRTAVQALAESEARFRSLFEKTSSIMLILEPDSGKIVNANPAASAFYGYPLCPLIGMNVDQIDILSAEETAFRRRQVLRGETSCLHCNHRLASGEVRSVDIYSSPIELDGTPLLFAVIHDVTERDRAEQSLKESLELLQMAQSMGGLGAFILDIPTGIWTSTDIMDQIFGIDKDYERTVEGWTNLIHPDDRTMMANYYVQDVCEQRRDFDKVYRIVRQNDQAVRWVHGIGKLECGEQGQLQKMTGVIRDITERKATELQIQNSEARYRTAFQTSLDYLSIWRLESGDFVDVNQAFLDGLGFTREEVIGCTLPDLNVWADPQARLTFLDLMRKESQCKNLEVRLRRKSGEVLLALVSASVMELDGVPCIFSAVRDISSTREAEQKIRDLAYYDSLTRLPNRHMLLDRLQMTFPSNTRIDRRRALLLVDLDNFKGLNDALGQETGDILLKEVAQRLEHSVRETDTVARLGSDEYAVLLEGLTKDPEDAATQASNVGEKILAAVSQPYLFGAHEYSCTASIGITVFGYQQPSPREILQQADIAMRKAKAGGRNTMHFFTPALQRVVNARAALEEDLRRAVHANQLQLYYQPQIEKNSLIGVEALVRWRHPRRGILAPGEFIPLAEETGLILPLGQWVLDAACRQIVAWSARKETANIQISVNISPRQFRQHDFVEQVLASIGRTGANPANLMFEITESILLDDLDIVAAKMLQLKVHGIHFSLDDFGTGYSSLSYLQRLPLDQMKIDQAFVRNLPDDPACDAIAQAIVSLGRVMGLAVVAEGVETMEQMAFLKRIGCEGLQGYLFSRPVPLAEFEEWFRNLGSRLSKLQNPPKHSTKGGTSQT
jgi:diguanylate cyclase (GGDEF)-like protein/PAS domain S-box-containing protein